MDPVKEAERQSIERLSLSVKFSDIDVGTIEDAYRYQTTLISMMGSYTAAINRGSITFGEYSNVEDGMIQVSRSIMSYLHNLCDVTEEGLLQYIDLLHASSLYFCGLYDSASIVVKSVSYAELDLGCEGLDVLLLWVLRGCKENPPNREDSRYSPEISNLVNSVDDNALLINADVLRSRVYACGTPRDLLFGDIISALVRKRISDGLR